MQFFLLTLIFPVIFAFRNQIVGVRGKLTCKNKILQGATVRLIEKNLIGPDVILAENKTDYHGAYDLVGQGRGLVEMNVVFRILHDCEDGIIPCQRTVSLRIPSSFITRSTTVNNYFEAGTMNMAFRYPDEQRSCRDRIFS